MCSHPWGAQSIRAAYLNLNGVVWYLVGDKWMELKIVG